MTNDIDRKVQSWRSPLLHFASANLWSPWFRIIMERFVREWWQNLPDALTTDKYVDTVNIHRFDPPSRYRGGAGVTGLLEEGTATSKIDKWVTCSGSHVLTACEFEVDHRSDLCVLVARRCLSEVIYIYLCSASCRSSTESQ